MNITLPSVAPFDGDRPMEGRACNG